MLYLGKALEGNGYYHFIISVMLKKSYSHVFELELEFQLEYVQRLLLT